MNTKIIENRLSKILFDYFKNTEGYDEKEIPSLNLYNIVFEENNDKNYIDVYIYTELDVDAFFNISDKLNNYIASVEKSAYFDILSPGIYMARIYLDSVEDTMYEITYKDLNKFGNEVIENLNDEFNEEFWVDDIKYDKHNKDIIIQVSSDSYEAMGFLRIDESALDNYEDLLNLYLDELIVQLENDILYE